MGQFQGWAQAAHTSTSEIAHKPLRCAEQKRGGQLRFAQKLMHAKAAPDVKAAVGLLSPQMPALSAQVQDLGQSAAKIVVDAAKSRS
jgi:hypothetical protein